MAWLWLGLKRWKRSEIVAGGTGTGGTGRAKRGAAGEEEDEGKKNPGELDGEFGLAGDGGEAGVEEVDEKVRFQNSDPDDGGEDDEKEGVDVIGEAIGGVFAFLGQFLGKGGDEGGGEGAFGKKIAQKVGDAESGDEGVEFLAGAEDGIEQDLADEAEDPGGPDGQHDAGGALGAQLASKMERAFFGSTALMGERT